MRLSYTLHVSYCTILWWQLSVEQWWNDDRQGNIKGSEGNLPQIVYHKSNRICILKLSQQLNSIQSSPMGRYVIQFQ